MNLIKFDPWPTEGRSFLHTNRMPGMLEDFFGRNIGDFIGADFATNVPSVNISETEKGFQIHVAAPGLTKDDFKIALDKDRLTISAEKSMKDETTEGKWTRREFNYSSFSRSFIMPKTVEKDHITAKYENGVLLLWVPKKEEVVKEEMSRVIEIK